MQLRAALAVAAAGIMVAGPSAPLAAEVTTYTYDAKGRITTACNAKPATGDLSRYRHDPADNRTSYSHIRTELTIPAETSIYSPNGKFMFRMQSDSNLVVYGNFGAGWTPLWASNTVGTGATFAAFQSDGNLVLYGPSGAVWASGTQYHCATLTMQNDGNVVIQDLLSNVLWSTGTGGH
ncbi:hypothetical protein [Sphingomonas sp. 66-10]|uniref:hypothetical protein n=1 Tax=Sphingomonas sp. 66-10 TaxID=1895848 RepID=UPI000AEE2029|nr:hypothetical protein [Sphingomonas sp. 66-10]